MCSLPSHTSIHQLGRLSSYVCEVQAEHAQVTDQLRLAASVLQRQLRRQKDLLGQLQPCQLRQLAHQHLHILSKVPLQLQFGNLSSTLEINGSPLICIKEPITIKTLSTTGDNVCPCLNSTSRCFDISRLCDGQANVQAAVQEMLSRHISFWAAILLYMSRARWWRCGRQGKPNGQDGWQFTQGHGHWQQRARPC